MKILVIKERYAVKMSRRSYEAHQRRELVKAHRMKAEFIRAIASGWEQTLQNDESLSFEEREQLSAQIEKARFDALAVDNCKCLDGQHVEVGL